MASSALSSFLASTSTRRLPPLHAIKDFLTIYRIDPKKVLSQNFLMDMNVTRKIVRKAGDMTNCYALEIGPGPGSITRAVLETDCKRLDVVEIDDRFMPALYHLQDHSEGRLHIHHGDILKVDTEQLWRDGVIPDEELAKFPQWNDADLPPVRIIGNLPFNIATPLIIKCLKEISYREGAWAFGRVPLVLTFQKEVALRIVGQHDSSDRARISAIAQFFTEPRILFELPGECFAPRPKIDVSVVYFEPRAVPLAKLPFEVVQKVLRAVFQFRGKQIPSGLRTLYPREIEVEKANDLINACRLNPTHTVGLLTNEDLSDIMHYYYAQCEEIPGLWPYDRLRNSRDTIQELQERPDAFPPKYRFGPAETWDERLERKRKEGLW